MNFDDDRFDAEIMVERSGLAFFHRHDLAHFLGRRPNTIWRMVRDGKLPQPHHYDTVEGRREAVWTVAQAAEMFLTVRKKNPARCGTEAGVRVHRRAGTPICEACREAHNEYQRKIRAARRVAA